MKSVTEWSAEFDILWNNIMSNQAPGLNEYEKSVFLTRAQEAVVVGVYRGTISVPLEATEEVTQYLSSLIRQADCNVAAYETIYHIKDDSVIYELPSDLLFRTYEKCVVELSGCGDTEANIVPVTQDEFWRTSRNPFKGANGKRVLRLSYADEAMEHNYSELVSDYPIKSYTVRYLAKPEPIILEAIPLTMPAINGERTAKTCKLHEYLHQTILAEAVNRAKAVWASTQ